MKKMILGALVLIGMAGGGALADGTIVQVVRVIDGDSIKVTAAPWPQLSISTNIRLDGIDTPEMRGKCVDEKQAARRARDRLAQLLAMGPVTLTNIHLGKYAGRVVATVLVDGVINVAAVMIGENLARPYFGGKRQGWCDGSEN